MGGKRPDQYRIDPAEAGATDYKTRVDDQNIVEQDKQALQSNSEKKPMIPEAGVNPALREQRARQQERARKSGDAGAGEEDSKR